MANNTLTTDQNRRTVSRARRTSAARPFAWMRHHGSAMTFPSQQAVDAISNTPDFPRH